MWNLEEFKGRVAVVTGGSDGIGQDFCRALYEVGCDLYFCARNASRGQAVAQCLGPRAHYFQMDLCVPEQIAAFAAYVRGHSGSVDYLVNNAANDDRIEFLDVTVDECDRMWKLNLRSYILTARAFLDLLHAGKGKSILNIGTCNWMRGETPFTLYNATKSGILGFTRSLARELGRDGIRVNMVNPGWVMTEKQLREYVGESEKQMLLQEQSLGFLVEPRHISPVMLFFLSSAAGAITGQNLVVDAGRVMQ